MHFEKLKKLKTKASHLKNEASKRATPDASTVPRDDNTALVEELNKATAKLQALRKRKTQLQQEIGAMKAPT
jgi:seryl-tRNA synthetase